MTAKRNPFEYVGANDLPPEMILDYYIEDFNYSRFIRSHRNVFLVGERGSGKSMSLLFNSWKVQKLQAARDHGPLTIDFLGVYIPCNTPLTHKMEYQLLGSVQAAILSEHFLVLSLAHAMAETLEAVPDALYGANEDLLREHFEYITGVQLPHTLSFFSALKAFVTREIGQTQRAINDSSNLDVGCDNTFTFASLIIPLLGLSSTIPRLKATHFLLLVDDAHDLNEHQIRLLNSWIAYRDHSLFSFKVAIASVSRISFKTTAGGTILEGHDFMRIDMIQPYQNPASNFGKLARRIIGQRLNRFDITTTADEFFPIGDQLKKELQRAREVARHEAISKYGEGNPKQINDYVYKYARAHYFKLRSPRANRPEYSGFDTLVFLSTGVIRNLLIPCYWMYDKVLSLMTDTSTPRTMPSNIAPSIQSEIIIDRSEALWDRLRSGLDQEIEGCTREDALRAYALMDNLALYFRKRLLSASSEPRANSFTVSAWSEELRVRLEHIFDVLIRAQLMYVRSGPAKDKGRRETYFVPNRLLWPARGLDAHGQHARVSLQAGILWKAASENREIPLAGDDVDILPGLFEE